MAEMALSRRLFLGGAAALTASAAAGLPAARRNKAPAAPPLNPLVRQRADAQIFRHDDGQYYMMASVPEYDRLAIRRAPTLAGLSDAEEAVVWRRPAQGRMAGHIWAPELHWFDGAWHIYFAAGDGGDVFHIRTYVLICRDRDPLRGSWTVMGQLRTPWDTFTLDSTLFTHRGQRYLCWAQREPGIDTNSNLYLAPLASPTTLAREPARLSVPTLDWETRGFRVNEGPALLARHGRLFLTYSASATDARYCLGMLTAADDADIMNPRAWTKAREPVFATSRVTGVYGPGHNSFTVDERGRDMLVYHGRDYEAISGDPLYDPNRHTRIQRLHYGPDGTPDFGIPVGNGPLPIRLGVAGGRHLYHDGDALRLGTGPEAASLFRERRAEAEGGFILAPIDAPGRIVAVRPDGVVALVADDGTAARGARFFRQAGPGGVVAFYLAAASGGYLQDHDGALVLGSGAAASVLFHED